MKITGKNIAMFLGWFLSAGALFYLIYRLIHYDNYAAFCFSFVLADMPQFIALLVAIALLPAQLFIESIKWQTMLQGLVQIPLHAAWWQVIYGNIAAFITPYRLGEYPARLLQMGYSWHEWQTFMGSWRDWLRDWRKWLRVLLLHLARYTVWMLQLWAILCFCGIHLAPSQAIVAIASYYFLITIMPSVPVADVAFKSSWAVVIFSHFTDNIPAIAVTVTLVWLVNTVLPVMFGIVFRGKK